MRNLTFPRQALRQGVENANTSLRFYVDAEGNVDASQTVAETTGGEGLENLFNEAAVQALSGCKFTPGTDGTGKRVGRRVRRTVSWRLDG